jgi:hypothetical protein
MTQEEKARYHDTDELRKIPHATKGPQMPVRLWHHVTIGHHLANDITIRNGKAPEIICSCCGY